MNNKSNKLLAYTLFAIGLPLWLFLGNLGKEKTNTTTIAVDSTTIKEVRQLLVTKTGENKDYDLQMQAMLMQNERTNKEIQDLAEILRNAQPISPKSANASISVTGIPSTIQVINPNAAIPSRPDPDSNLLVDIKNKVRQIQNEINAQEQIPFFDPVLMQLYDVDVNKKSINAVLNINSFCCMGYNTVNTQMVSEINSISRLNDDMSKTKKFAALYIENNKAINDINEQLKNYIGLINSKCEARKLVIGIRNTSNKSITLSKNSDFDLRSRNILDANSAGELSAFITMKPNDIAYFTLAEKCTSSKYTKPIYSTFAFAYDIKRPFLSRNSDSTFSYLNLSIINK